MSRPKRVLIVDDDAFIRRPLEQVLRDAGFDTMTASNGEECLHLVDADPPDLIFLDVMMPGRDGFSVCGSLRDHPRFRRIPIILLSARGREGDRERGLDAGAVDFMTKPYSPSHVVRRVRDILRAPDAEEGIANGR